MYAIVLVLLGTLLALAMGVRLLVQADALAAFCLYQAALGVADLITLGLRSRRRQPWIWSIAPGLWLATLALAVFCGGPWWALAAVGMAWALVWLHRPDVGLFSAATLPVSLALIAAAVWRGESFPVAYLALLLSMAMLFAWKARANRRPRIDLA